MQRERVLGKSFLYDGSVMQGLGVDEDVSVTKEISNFSAEAYKR